MIGKDILKSEAELLLNAAKTEPVSTFKGMEYYTYEDAARLNQAILRKGPEFFPEVSERETVNGGLGYTSSRRWNVAINPATFFDNRFRKIVIPGQPAVKATKENKGTKEIPERIKYEVVTDSRAIQEQSSGRVYTNNILSYIVEKTKKGLAVESSVVSDTEFVNEFKQRMSDADMRSVLEALTATAGEISEPQPLGL